MHKRHQADRPAADNFGTAGALARNEREARKESSKVRRFNTKRLQRIAGEGARGPNLKVNGKTSKRFSSPQFSKPVIRRH